jgi:hypothetical protein
MTMLILLAPYFPNGRKDALRVKTVQVPAALAWKEYLKHKPLLGVDVKLSRIPRHTCGTEESAIKKLKHAQHAIAFVDAAECVYDGEIMDINWFEALNLGKKGST